MKDDIGYVQQIEGLHNDKCHLIPTEKNILFGYQKSYKQAMCAHCIGLLIRIAKTTQIIGAEGIYNLFNERIDACPLLVVYHTGWKQKRRDQTPSCDPSFHSEAFDYAFPCPVLCPHEAVQ